MDEEAASNPLKSKNEEYALPEIYSMQLNKKIFNNRLQNKFENLGNLVTGMSKDINEMSSLILSLEKYGSQMHNLKKDVQQIKLK